MRRYFALVALAIVAFTATACSDITAPKEREACPIMNGSGRCDGGEG